MKLSRIEDLKDPLNKGSLWGITPLLSSRRRLRYIFMHRHCRRSTYKYCQAGV